LTHYSPELGFPNPSNQKIKDKELPAGTVTVFPSEIMTRTSTDGCKIRELSVKTIVLSLDGSPFFQFVPSQVELFVHSLILATRCFATPETELKFPPNHFIIYSKTTI
jgi:hypothetical protein